MSEKLTIVLGPNMKGIGASIEAISCVSRMRSITNTDLHRKGTFGTTVVAYSNNNI